MGKVSKGGKGHENHDDGHLGQSECSWVRARLKRFAEGEVSHHVLKVVTRHTQACHRCMEEANRLRRSVGMRRR